VHRLGFSGLAAVLAAGGAIALATVPTAAQNTGVQDALRSSTPGQPSIPTAPAPDSLFDPNAPYYANPPGFGAGGTGFTSDGTARRKKPRPGFQPYGAFRPRAPGQPGNPTGPGASSTPGMNIPAPPGTAGVRQVVQTTRRGVPPIDPVPDINAAELAPPVVLPPRRPPVDSAPFDPLGVRVGSFIFNPAVELTAGYDSNPPRVSPAKGSAEFLVAPELTVRSDWERHALGVDIHGSYLWYGENFSSVPGSPTSLDRPGLDSRIFGRIDATKNDHIIVESRLLLSTDNPGSPNIQAGLVRLPIVTTLGGTLGYTHDFNRFEIAAKATVDRSVWQDSTLTDGTTSSNDDRNFNQYGGVLRGSYELLPGVAPFIEGDIDTRVHDLKIDRTGADRDSVGETVKVGTSFRLTGKLTGEVSIGETDRRYQDWTLPDIKGPVFDGSLLYAATALTTVKLTAATATGELIVAGASGVLRRDFGAEVDHDFRRWLTGAVRFGYGADTYFGLDRFDNRYLAAVSLVYKLTREVAIKGELRHEWLRSTYPGVNYDADVALLTVRLQR
jgi:hypothetical protein